MVSIFIHQERIQREFVGFSKTPLSLETSFSWEILDKFDKFDIPYLC